MTKYAIVGTACLFPDAATPAEFWDNLVAGTDSRRDGGEAVFGPDLPTGDTDEGEETAGQHRITCTRGGFVDGFAFDPAGFRLSPEHLSGLDRVFQWSLHVAREVLRDAGREPAADDAFARTGVVLGNYSFPTVESSRRCLPLWHDAVFDGLRAAGLTALSGWMAHSAGSTGHMCHSPSENLSENLWAGGLPARVVGAALGLGGPQYAVDAACSSALYGLQLACDHLATGEVDLMLAGAVCAPDPTLLHLSFSDLGAYPGDGPSQPFDAGSRGIVTGQGAAMVAVRRLADAVRDGDPIHAVVDGTGLGNDGTGRHLLVPNPAGQLAAYRLAYDRSGVDPADIDYVECHATGTPVGDRTELDTVAEFFGDGAPLLGSVKANVGHLLTVAGFTSLLKVVLSMRHGVIPPTPGIDDAMDDRIVRETRDWPDRDGPRRAGVSAFGFGGTNCHVVLSEPGTAGEPEVPDVVPVPRMAITGMGCHLGPLTSVEEFERAGYDGEPATGPVPPLRWRGFELSRYTPEDNPLDRDAVPDGAFVDGFDVDALGMRIPPAELDDVNAQHLLLLRAATEALSDAGYDRGDKDPRRVAVVVAMEMEPSAHGHLARLQLDRMIRERCADAGLDLPPDRMDELVDAARSGIHGGIEPNAVMSYIGNVMAARVSSLWNFTGPSFTVSADTSSPLRALEVASLLLLDDTVDAVLVGAVDLAGGPENMLARAGSPDQGPVGEGAAAIVVTRADSRKDDDAAYAVVEAIRARYPAGRGGSLDGLVSADDVRAAAHDALAAAGVEAKDIGYVESAADGPGEELAGLGEVYSADRAGRHACAIGNSRAIIGDGRGVAALASVIRGALCLRHGYLPGRGEVDDDLRAALDGSAFYLPAESRPWVPAETDQRRHAAVSVIGSAGTVGHVVLSGGRTIGEERPADWDRGRGGLLLTVAGDDPDDLTAALTRHREALADPATDPRRLAATAAAERAGHRLCAVLVAPDRERLLRELDQAVRDLPGVCADGGEWRTPAGSYFTASPIGDATVALVFPGAFTTYPGIGADLFRAFPGLLSRFVDGSGRPAELLRERLLYPRGIDAVDRRELMRRETALLADIPAMLAAGTSFAAIHAVLLRELLGVTPHGAFGYSLGESSMMFAMGGWEQSADGHARLDHTPLFRDRLCGPKRTVRELWDLGDDVPDASVWATHVLLAEPERVRASLDGFDRVFLTHVNTPREVVVAGAPDQCAALIEAVDCQAARAPANHVMHCSVVDGEADELAELNRYPAHVVDDVELLTADGYATVEEFDTDAIATRIARTLCHTIDFVRLVRTAYDRGYRYFLELGPGGTCARWISDTLADEPHVAASLDRRGMAATATIGQTLAQLVSHGVPVDLGVLFPSTEEPAADEAAGLSRRIVCGAEPVSELVRANVTAVLAGTTAASETKVTGASESVSRPAVERVPAMAGQSGITFDGEPFDALAGGPTADRPVSGELVVAEPPATRPHHRRVNRSVNRNGNRSGNGHNGFDPHSGYSPDSRRLIRETREQLLAGHRAAMSAQRLLAERALRALETNGRPTQKPTQRPTEEPEKRPDVVWDEEQLLEFATGSVAAVFGPDFAEVDTYPQRVRLPAPPYLFVSRVTALDGETGRFEPSSMTTEYDVPRDAWYASDGQVPPAVTIEAGQCDLLLVSYLGIDFHNQGDRVYRLLDSALTFHGDLPTEGQTLRYDISIDDFVGDPAGRDGQPPLFFFSYRCYADGEPILELKRACAGFFDRAMLDKALGVVDIDRRREQRRATVTPFRPLARSDRDELDESHLSLLSQGRIADVFGPAYEQDGCNPSLRLADERLRLVDHIEPMDRFGGPRGLGRLAATKRLDPDAWYFRCHFPDDPVLAGSLVAEGAVQLLQTYAMYLGMHLCLPDARFQPIPGLETDVQVRGQITPECQELRYELDIVELDLLPWPRVVADVYVYRDGTPVTAISDLGIQLKPKPGTEYRPGAGGRPAAFLGRRNASGEPAMLSELHMAHAAKGDLGIAMGLEFEVYRDSRAPYIPNGDFLFVDRVMRLDGERGDPKPGDVMVTEYDSPPEAWYHNESAYPGMPNCVYMETSLQAAILLGYYLGATLPTPDVELSIRNLDGTATVTSDVDLRGRTIRQESTLVSHTAGGGGVLQSFTYRLTADGEPFYEGESLYGYFTEEALAGQTGLDGGESTLPWLDRQDDPPTARRIDLRDDPRWYGDERPDDGLRLGVGHLALADRLDVVDGPDAPDEAVAYLRGHRRIREDDWYFDCHFHRDPVMPGSLGIEAIVQAMQAYVIDAGLADDIDHPRFAPPVGVSMGWKYRGQILRDDPDMDFEVTVKEVRREGGGLLVIGDASLWKPGLRIYEVTDVAVRVVPAGPTTKEGAR